MESEAPNGRSKIGRTRKMTAKKSDLNQTKKTNKPQNISLKPPFIDDVQVPLIFLPPIRLVDLNVLAHKLWCSTCSLPLSLRDCVEDQDVSIYKSDLKIACSKCLKIILVPLTVMDANGNLAAYGCKKAIFRDILRSKLGIICNETNCSYSPETNAKMGICGDNNEESDSYVATNSEDDIAENQPVEESAEAPQLEAEIKVEVTEDIQGELVVPSREEPAAISMPAVKKRGRKQTLEVLRDEPLTEASMHQMVEVNIPNIKIEVTEEISDLAPIEPEITNEMSDDDELTSEYEAKEESDSDDWKPEESESEESSFDEVETDTEIDEETGRRKQKKSEWKEKCFYCPLEFTQYAATTKHMRAEHPDFLALKCGVCQFISKTTLGFSRHLDQHRPSKKRMFCEFCGTFWTTKDYESHMVSVHNAAAAYACAQCPAKLKTASKLAYHIKIVHNKRTCDFCKKTVGRKRIENHILTHIGVEKRYKCKICHARFVHQDNMNTHMKNNHIYVCLVCFKQFTCRPEEVQKHAIKEHMTEEIEKSSVDGKCYEKVTRFQCQVCYEYFASKQSLQFHMHTHIKDEPESQDGPQPKRRKKMRKSRK